MDQSGKDLESSGKSIYDGFVKWSRRLSALATYMCFYRWIFDGITPQFQMMYLLGSLFSQIAPQYRYQIAVAILVIWCAFLTQLKIRWTIWLPFYLILFPISWLLGILIKKLAAQIKSFENSGVATTSKIEASRIAGLPIKRIWLTLFFLWFLVFRGFDLPWGVWILPILILPLWLFCMKIAYKTAITPTILATLWVKIIPPIIEGQIKTFEKSKISDESKRGFSVVYGLADLLLRRYSPDRVQAVIQREAIAIFSFALLLSILVSSVFWGQIAQALMQTHSDAFQAYGFFNSNNLTECILWAWGCMSTTINFPGSIAPTWLKMFHAAILFTGIFQLTYLLACFAIMASAEGRRIADQTNELLGSARERLNILHNLEISAVNITDQAAQIDEKANRPEDPSGNSGTT